MLLRTGSAAGGKRELVRRADALHVAGKGGGITSGSTHIAGDDQGRSALFALAGAQAEIDVRHDHITAGAVLDLVGQQEVLESVTRTAVAVDGARDIIGSTKKTYDN